MRIERIALYNFGSYEGEAVFDTRTDKERNIILVGGKNGAGKTTLFTAMRVCLYGYMGMGYKNQGAYYTRAVSKFLNSSAKLTRPTKAHVQMEICINNGRELDRYVLTRAWVLGNALSETFEVEKNEAALGGGERADFEKYLRSLIPPELFDLYFFDGEKIADFFLDEGGSARIKGAFLTLCGYDVFDIMRKNFRRLHANSSKSLPDLEEYLQAEEWAEQAQAVCQGLSEQLRICAGELESCEGEIAALERDYHEKGGMTQDEWAEKLLAQKEEDKKRDRWNGLLKKWANDLIPFLMVRDQVLSVKKQIEAEAGDQKYRDFCEVLDTPEISRLVGGQAPALKEIARGQFGSGGQPLLNLSLEQSAAVLGQIKQVADFDIQEVSNCKRSIKRSLDVSAAIRQELENSSVSAVQEYMGRRAQLFENKSRLLERQSQLERQLPVQKEVSKQADEELARKKARLEDELKRASINDISARAIVMLDKLQKVLYRRQMEQVEAAFRREVNALMRKKHFIDDIRIDGQFNVHIYRMEDLSAGTLAEALEANSEEEMRGLLGDAAMERLRGDAAMEWLRGLADADGPEGVAAYCRAQGDATLTLPVEIDKNSLSNGEKQIFIMALYYALVQLCGHEIPFIIDTPFARIDTEHRQNISQHFFRKLEGQVFILSTDEEIDSDHVRLLEDRIASAYLLESVDNKRTAVIKNSYFEVPHGF